MAPVTLVYVFELLAFALVGTLLQGTLLWMSWRLLSRAIPVSYPLLRYRVAGAHFALMSGVLPSRNCSACDTAFNPVSPMV